MTMEYGYNGGALNDGRRGTSTNGTGDQGGVQLTSWSSSYSSAQTQDQRPAPTPTTATATRHTVTDGRQGSTLSAGAPYYDSTGEITLRVDQCSQPPTHPTAVRSSPTTTPAT